MTQRWQGGAMHLSVVLGIQDLKRSSAQALSFTLLLWSLVQFPLICSSAWDKNSLKLFLLFLATTVWTLNEHRKEESLKKSSGNNWTEQRRGVLRWAEHGLAWNWLLRLSRWSPLCLRLISCSGGAISESPFLGCGTALAYGLSPKRRYGKRFMVSGVWQWAGGYWFHYFPLLQLLVWSCAMALKQLWFCTW